MPIYTLDLDNVENAYNNIKDAKPEVVANFARSVIPMLINDCRTSEQEVKKAQELLAKHL